MKPLVCWAPRFLLFMCSEGLARPLGRCRDNRFEGAVVAVGLRVVVTASVSVSFVVEMTVLVQVISNI